MSHCAMPSGSRCVSNSVPASVKRSRARWKPPAAVSINARRIRHCARPRTSPVALQRALASLKLEPRAGVVAEEVVDLAEHHLRLRRPSSSPRLLEARERVRDLQAALCRGTEVGGDVPEEPERTGPRWRASPAWANARRARPRPDREPPRGGPMCRSASARHRAYSAAAGARHAAVEELRGPAAWPRCRGRARQDPAMKRNMSCRGDVVVPRAQEVRDPVLHDAARADRGVLGERVRREAEDGRRVVALVQALRAGAPAGARAASGTGRCPRARRICARVSAP